MTEHRVRTAEVAAVVDDLASITAAIEEALEQADAASARMHAAWSGEAAVAHAAAHARWAADAAAMREALSRLRGLLATAGGNYDHAAAANSRMWS